MNQPFKIIYKYKNNHNNIQYQIYIFLGFNVSEGIKKILDKIKTLNLYESLIQLNQSNLKEIEKVYGENWYEYFFNSNHIDKIKKDIINSNKKVDLIRKFSTEWFDKHFDNYIVKRIKSNYSYAESLYKNTKNSDDDIEDFRVNVYTSNPINDFKSPETNTMEGGGFLLHSIPEESIQTKSNSNMNDLATREGDEIVYDVEDFEEMIEKDTIDKKELNKVQDEIEAALKLKKKKKNLEKFNKSNDNKMYDEDISNIFEKNYIYENYIYVEDTIENVKNKICMSIPNNDKFIRDGMVRTLPSCQYLWSEYDYLSNKQVKTDKVMLGHKWVRKSDLLMIEVEPNKNLSIYENLHNNLVYLKENIRKFSSKIRLDLEDKNKCVYDYFPFNRYNEFYLIDIYNDLGVNYSSTPEKLDNLFKVYVKIYYPNISFEDFKNILDFLNPKKKEYKSENIRMTNNSQKIIQNLITENEIIREVELNRDNDKIKNYFKEKTNVIQSTIHVKLNVESLNLYRIMDNFIVSSEYPIVQFMNDSNRLVFKFFSKSQRYNQKNISKKWFDNEQTGLNFKIRLGIEKFMNVKITTRGNVEYKTSMKEEEKVSIDSVVETYVYLKNLIKKINSENKNQYIPIPLDNEFTFAYINTIQKFELPKNKLIKHNDLSEFIRYFYPYVTIVVDPRKRESKNKKEKNFGKFGTYFRYRRISYYDNDGRIEQKIRYYFKNFETSDHQLANVLSQIFNINESEAMKEIQSFKKKYPNMRRNKKKLKKIESAPRNKPPGIEIAIQGKKPDNYKIRVTGARNKMMLNRIVNFYKILIYLYIETYILKNRKREDFLKILKTLSSIAKRRHRVVEMIDVPDDSSVSSIKKMGNIDKATFGFKPGKNQNQYSRLCQKSADMNRRPTIYTQKEALENDGYRFNPDTKQYEREVTIKEGKKITKHTLTAVVIQSSDYYITCSPEVNKEYIFVDILSKSVNPSKRCMPCCYKKNPMLSNDPKRRNIFMRCAGMDTLALQNNASDRLYLLQDSIKFPPPKRMGILPETLNIFFNQHFGLKYELKKNLNQLSHTDGFYFKYGVDQNLPFLSSISEAYDVSISDIKNNIKMIFTGKLKSSYYSNLTARNMGNTVFTYLNDGDIKNQYETIEKYLYHMLETDTKEFNDIYELLCLPGIVKPKGIFPIILSRTNGNDFIIQCYGIDNKSNDISIIIEDQGSYYLIAHVSLENTVRKKDKNHKITKIFTKEDKIINHVMKYFHFNCSQNTSQTYNDSKNHLTAEKIYNTIMSSIESNKLSKEFVPINQTVDIMNKSQSIELKNGIIIPFFPSGSILNIPIKESIQPKLNYQKMYDIIKNSTLMTNLFKIKGILINNKSDIKKISPGKMLEVTDLLTNEQVIPVIPLNVTKSTLMSFAKKHNLYITNKPQYQYTKMDEEIIKGEDNYLIDERIINVNRNQWIEESYHLFRLEVSEGLIKYSKFKDYLKKVLINDTIGNKEIMIKKVLYKLCDIGMYHTFLNVIDSKNQEIKLSSPNLIKIMKKETFESIDFSLYNMENIRNTCDINITKETCDANLHCRYYRNECKFTITARMMIKFISRLTNELLNKGVGMYEIMKESIYSVSDVINTNKFTVRNNQSIIETGNENKEKFLDLVFGDNKPIIGKRKEPRVEDLVEGMVKKGNYSSQVISSNQDTIFRAFANSYYWLMNPMYDLEDRNLGYISSLQVELGNFMKKQFIEYIIKKNSMETVYKNINPHISIKFDKFKFLVRDKIMLERNAYNFLIEMYVLNQIYDIPIVIYNDFDSIIYVFDKKIVFDKFKKIGSNAKYIPNLNQYINIKFEYQHNFITPVVVHSIYR